MHPSFYNLKQHYERKKNMKQTAEVVKLWVKKNREIKYISSKTLKIKKLNNLIIQFCLRPIEL